MNTLRGALGAAIALMSVAGVAKVMGSDFVGALACAAAICIMVALLIRKPQ